MQSGEKLLLVAEDLEDDFRLLELALKSRDGIFHCVWVKDGDEAIQYLLGQSKYSDRKKFPPPDLILLDLKMPRCNGFDFLSRFARLPESRRIPVVVLTSSENPSDIAQAYALGARAYIVKPSSLLAFRQEMKGLTDQWLSRSADSPGSA